MPDQKTERASKAAANWIKVKYQHIAENSIKFLDVSEYPTGRELKVEAEFKVIVGKYVQNDIEIPIVKPYHLTLYVSKQWKVVHHEEPIIGEQQEWH